MSTRAIAQVALNDAYVAKVNQALAAGQEDRAAELADEYLDELARAQRSAA